MSYFTEMMFKEKMTYDAGGRIRTSNITTLFDGKTLDADETELWHGAGTGTFSWANNKSTMSVTAGQWYLRQQNWYNSYSSGKSQLQEYTMLDFDSEEGVEKGFGYISSSAISPHTDAYDGYAVIDTGTTKKLNVYNSGTIVASIDWTDWDSYQKIASYDFSKFTVFAVDFLWLGGTEIRLFMKSPTGGFMLLHTYKHAGTAGATDTMFKSPNQPVRFWIRSSTGTGTYTPVCSQVATEGSYKESGQPIVLFNTTAIACNAIGTIYALKSVKKQAAYRDTSIQFTRVGAVNTGTVDNGILMLLKNPTLSAPIAYANKGRIQEGSPTNQTITADTGTLIAAIPVSNTGVSDNLDENFLVNLQSTVDNTMAEYVLAYLATTLNQSLNGVITMKAFN
jgi:hypothetical protein